MKRLKRKKRKQFKYIFPLHVTCLFLYAKIMRKVLLLRPLASLLKWIKDFRRMEESLLQSSVGEWTLMRVCLYSFVCVCLCLFILEFTPREKRKGAAFAFQLFQKKFTLWKTFFFLCIFFLLKLYNLFTLFLRCLFTIFDNILNIFIYVLFFL